MTGDLHCHTRLSDGSLGIDDVVICAKKRGLSFLAISDHDTTLSYNRALIVGQRVGINIMPAVELSAFDSQRGNKAHILTYLYDYPNRLEGICRQNCENRKRAGNEMLRLLTKEFPINTDFVARYLQGSQSVYRQPIMHALMDLGYTDRIYGDLYQKLFGSEGSCRVKMTYPEVREVLDVVHLAGGIAILAHPGEYDGLPLLEELAQTGKIDGVELHHPSNSPVLRKTVQELAQRYSLLTTGGSDFHGMYGAQPVPVGEDTAAAEEIDQLYQFKEKQKKK